MMLVCVCFGNFRVLFSWYVLRVRGCIHSETRLKAFDLRGDYLVALHDGRAPGALQPLLLAVNTALRSETTPKALTFKGIKWLLKLRKPPFGG